MLIVANWKMNGSISLLKECLKKWQSQPTDNTIVVCPPFPYLQCAQENSRFIKIGGQTCHDHEKGAYTGHVSVLHLKETGCTYGLVGHSERRLHDGETSEQVRKKASLLLDHGITPIICVGETLEQYEQEISEEVVKEQLQESIPPCAENIFIAYEPVWAIGTGKTATDIDIAQMHAFINNHFPSQGILYGGSVTAENAGRILKLPHVQGVLVGGASLKKDDFFQIIHS